ncbi:MAG: UDP-N-acetylglucosamine 1-carboxyvinyltransferase [Oscillospiraceae bacterium]|jgi:UDP-N-acetylglucosamine 1-carboxyvinyltransferase|nr:UDP-N-acetylglucosamine 1-carboxyvinyltransferase [Oscillospiraceae bacterium]
MTKYVINGGKPLFGELEVSGAKNAAVAIIPAALLVDGQCRIENIPRISDVTMLLGILRQMGAKVNVVNKSAVEIDCSNINGTQATFDDMRRIRASYYLLGALLGRYGKASIAMPGGCNFGGVRPIDQHIKGFAAMGASVGIKNGIVSAETAGRASGATIYFDIVSVGATINIILSSVLAQGRTVIENAAKEPHIVDLASFLNSMGADVRGAGTNIIKINGVRRLAGGSYSIIPDQIEAGTYMAAAAGTGGSVAVKNVIPKHLASISGKLREMGVEVFEGDDAVVVTREAPLRRTNVITLPYPGFPTDMQPQLSAVLCLAKGTSVVTEGVWDNRFKYVGELAKMGGNIQVGGRTAIIEGVAALTGAPLKSCDLRAGAALVIAGLCAGGVTEIEGVEYIERGYEDIVGKLRGLGADIRSIYAPDRSEFSMRTVG